MNESQRDAVLTVTLMAAYADGSKSQAERQQFRQAAANLSGEGVDLPRLLERVLLKQVTIADLATVLQQTEHRQFAYEMAVVMCDADGQTTAAERLFLDELRAALGLSGEASIALVKQADDLVQIPLSATTTVNENEVDAMVLRYAILNGALELLPQNLATLAILPLQTKMVYRIGKQYGHNLDKRSIGEFLAVLGLGATSQMLENMARKFLGGLGKKLAGGMGKTAAKWGTGPIFSFASTYAIGQLAKTYYAGGRTLSAADLKARFTGLVEQGKGLYDRHRGDVEQQAATIKPTEIFNMVRGA